MLSCVVHGSQGILRADRLTCSSQLLYSFSSDNCSALDFSHSRLSGNAPGSLRSQMHVSVFFYDNLSLWWRKNLGRDVIITQRESCSVKKITRELRYYRRIDSWLSIGLSTFVARIHLLVRAFCLQTVSPAALDCCTASLPTADRFRHISLSISWAAS